MCIHNCTRLILIVIHHDTQLFTNDRLLKLSKLSCYCYVSRTSRDATRSRAIGNLEVATAAAAFLIVLCRYATIARFVLLLPRWRFVSTRRLHFLASKCLAADNQPFAVVVGDIVEQATLLLLRSLMISFPRTPSAHLEASFTSMSVDFKLSRPATSPNTCICRDGSTYTISASNSLY